MALRPSDIMRGATLDAKLVKFDSEVEALLGIKNGRTRAVLVEQIIESLRRIEFVYLVRDGRLDPRRADPSSGLFDPIRAAAFNLRKGELDEAFWLIFLSTHFGKHVRHGWGLTRAVYGGSDGETWTWKRVSGNVDAFRRWLSKNEPVLKLKYAFSNHRKYQSLSAVSGVGTGAVVASYVKWVEPPRTHLQMIQDVHTKAGQNPRAVFDFLYLSLIHISEPTRQAEISYAVFCLKKKNKRNT